MRPLLLSGAIRRRVRDENRRMDLMVTIGWGQGQGPAGRQLIGCFWNEQVRYAPSGRCLRSTLEPDFHAWRWLAGWLPQRCAAVVSGMP